MASPFVDGTARRSLAVDQVGQEAHGHATSLRAAHAAVHEQPRSQDEPGLVGGQEQGRGRDVLRLPEVAGQLASLRVSSPATGSS